MDIEKREEAMLEERLRRLWPGDRQLARALDEESAQIDWRHKKNLRRRDLIESYD